LVDKEMVLPDCRLPAWGLPTGCMPWLFTFTVFIRIYYEYQRACTAFINTYLQRTDRGTALPLAAYPMARTFCRFRPGFSAACKWFLWHNHQLCL